MCKLQRHDNDDCVFIMVFAMTVLDKKIMLLKSTTSDILMKLYVHDISKLRDREPIPSPLSDSVFSLDVFSHRFRQHVSLIEDTYLPTKSNHVYEGTFFHWFTPTQRKGKMRSMLITPATRR